MLSGCWSDGDFYGTANGIYLRAWPYQNVKRDRRANTGLADAFGIAELKTDTGYMKLSSPELTALDLLRYPRTGAGLDNIATVIADLASGGTSFDACRRKTNDPDDEYHRVRQHCSLG